jgi:small nuclear ribonucleoprotein (snRNP)-like protein
MAEVPLGDLFDELTRETRDVIQGGATISSDAVTSTGSADAIPTYDPSSELSIPLQVLQHALKHELLVSVETVQGYLYQGTLQAVDPYCNLTLSNVSVFRRRVPHIDFKQGSVMHANGTPMGYETSVMLRGPQIILVELPSETLKHAYTQMARSVRRFLQKKRKMAVGNEMVGGAAAAATAAAGPVISSRHGHQTSREQRQHRKPNLHANTKKKMSARKVLFRKDKPA